MYSSITKVLEDETMLLYDKKWFGQVLIKCMV